MGTTLVNVGILNGRSAKLDSDDLYALAELVETHSTDIVVTTPEIVFPPSEEETTAADKSADGKPAAATEGAAAEVKSPERTSAKPSTVNTEPSSNSKQLPSKQDGASARADNSHAKVVQPKLKAGSKPEEVTDRSSKQESIYTHPDPQDAPASGLVIVDVQPKAKTAIEKAKQAAIEAAMLAASDSVALSKTKLPATPQSKPVEKSDAGQKAVSDQPVETKPEIAPNDTATKSVSANNERLKRDNLIVEEISARLAKELEGNLAQHKTDATAAQQKIAILPPSEKQYERLIDNLLEKTVPGLPSAMLIAGCETNNRLGKVAMNVAALLAERNLGKILLVDGDVVDKALTDFLINIDAPGLTEVLNRQQSVMSAIMPTEIETLFFLPAGIASLSRQKTLNSRLASFNEELKREFRFVLIDGGVAQELMPKTWSAFCDSTYLVVSLDNTLNTAATSAVADLQSAGARLLGCIVTNQP